MNSAERPRSLLDIFPDIDREVLVQFEEAVRNGKDVTIPAVIYSSGHQIWLTFLASIPVPNSFDTIYVKSLKAESDKIAKAIADFYRTDTRKVQINTSDGAASIR